MYRDPRNRRDNEIKVRLNERELKALENLTDRLGSQPAVVARDLMLQALKDYLERNTGFAA